MKFFNKIVTGIVRLAVSYCTKRALVYEQRLTFLKEFNQSHTLIWSIGSTVMYRDEWLKRIVKIQNLIRK